MMYDWLEKELAEIKTPKFHLVDGPATEALRGHIHDLGVPIPPSYEEFIVRFGNAKLYRQGSSYIVGVRAFPEPAMNGPEPLRSIGHFDDVRAYFKDGLLLPGCEAPVFEWGSAGLRRASETFEQWLEQRCKDAHKRYSKAQWAEVVRGPKPFSVEEEAIVAARRQFRWKLIGISPTGELRFEVENRSSRTLPYLSVGVRSHDGRITGGVWLSVTHVAPGTKAIVEKECYKGLASPDTLEVFELPDPNPEDRNRYWEFRR